MPKKQFIALLILAPLCAWLVYRNIVAPAPLNGIASVPPAGTAQGAEQAPAASRPAASRNVRQQRDRTMSLQELAALDPTLRLDLLEQIRQVDYIGPVRNIFEPYTPPPPPQPVAAAPVTAPVMPRSSGPAPLNIPWKFYGMAVRSGSFQKKAFLTDGEEIFIGEEGSQFARRYKIIRIGVNSIEVEDTQTSQKQQLPLQEQ
ncbi:MAG: hypothetical protein HY649_02980 [Acidobacteria bacterium]|nr:hypothetical protein [Acidobacteriota bacterium]